MRNYPEETTCRVSKISALFINSFDKNTVQVSNASTFVEPFIKLSSNVHKYNKSLSESSINNNFWLLKSTLRKFFLKHQFCISNELANRALSRCAPPVIISHTKTLEAFYPQSPSLPIIPSECIFFTPGIFKIFHDAFSTSCDQECIGPICTDSYIWKHMGGVTYTTKTVHCTSAKKGGGRDCLLGTKHVLPHDA